MHNKLRYFRRARNMTLAQVADRLGTTPQTVSRLENEVITLSADWLTRFGELFDVDPGQLLGGTPAQAIEQIGRLDRYGRLIDEAAEGFDLALPAGPTLAVTMGSDIGPYSAGDVLLASRLEGPDMANAIGHDALVAVRDGPVLLRRLINGATGDFTLVPLASGGDVHYHARLNWAARITMRISYF